MISRNFNTYKETLDNVSKIVMYPVNGTTIVYRETTFRPLLPDVVAKAAEEANNGEDGSYLPFATWSDVEPDVDAVEAAGPGDEKPDDENQEDLEARDEEVVEAADFGLEAMNDLYYIKEPKLFSMGLFLTEDNPARYVAAFNDQSDEARQLARFGFAALEGAKLYVSKHPDISRAETFVKDTRRTALHRQCPRRGIPPCPPASLRYRTTDGSCNNPNELWWGSAMSPMQRFLQPTYQDGIQTIRRSVNGRLLPSPREISSFIHQDRDIPLASVTHMLMQWGQFVDHDLTATGQSRGFNGTVPQCCANGGAGFQPPEFMHPECLPIPVPTNDRFYGPLGVRCLEFVRSGAAPREDCGFGARDQLSQVTSYLDASTVYSSNVQTSDSLRLFRNGLLQYGRIQSRKPLLPRQESDLCRRGSLATSCFRAGDGRLSEQPALISMHVIFLRQHNRIATELAALNPHWSDEKLFQETRRIIGAFVQLITYREFLPIVLGPDVMKAFDLEVTRKGYYEGYDPTVNPNVANSFAAAAYRFGHSLVQHSFVRYDTDHQPIFNNVSIHDEFNNPVNLHTPGSVDRLLLGLVNQPSQKRDEFITSELTNHLFETPGFPGMDLASLNIQRGRDHGLPPYVDWREPCGLSPIKGWDDLDRVMPSASARRFRVIYTSVQDIDLFPGGLAEKPVPGGLVGPTFACIIAQQFSNIRKGDRFWFENPNGESSFTPAQLQQIKRVTLAQILCKTADSIETIQPFVFLTPDTFRNQRIECANEIIGSLDLAPWAERVPPEQRSNVRTRTNNKAKRRHANRRKGDTGSAVKNDDDIGGDEDARVRNQAEEKSWFSSFWNPPKTGINQQNKVIIRRPAYANDNLTVLVQNNAVNSPVFISDSIKGSNFQLTQAENRPYAAPQKPVTHDSAYPTASYKPNHHTSPRPIYYDDTEPNPVLEIVHQPAPKPKPKPKPKPPTYTNPNPYQGPYIPHSAHDPSNPNPPNYGFASRPINNNVPHNYYFDSFAGTTTMRPTLYTVYTTFKRPLVTERPTIYYDEIPANNQGHHHDQHHVDGYGSPGPSTSSWYMPKPIQHATNDPGNSYQGSSSWSQRPIYETSWSHPENENGQDEWVEWSEGNSQANSGYGSRPSHSRPTTAHRPSTGYWAEYSTSTKKYPSTHNYFNDAEWQAQNAASNINPRPFTQQSQKVTIVSDSDTEIHYPTTQRFQAHKKNEVPRPLINDGFRDEEDDFAEHKNRYEVDLGRVTEQRPKPGQFYYDKNVLRRYPSANDTGDRKIGPNRHQGDDTGAHKSGYQEDEKDHENYGIKIDRITVIDDKYKIEQLDPNRKGGPGPVRDTETKADVVRDENKLTTTATIVLDDEDYLDEGGEDDYYDGEDVDPDRVGILGSYSETIERVASPEKVMNSIDWKNVQENSSLTLNLEMPNLLSDELLVTREIPKPLKRAKPAM
ncbi:uncharacterized protein LOC105684530 isoform X2 [Athalia rosae]|nr:uncharacterized protein LOC105684530 isoform X2 [Athalia rosae]